MVMTIPDMCKDCPLRKSVAKSTSKAGKASWQGLSKEERSKRASDNRRKGWERVKAEREASECSDASALPVCRETAFSGKGDR